MKAVILAAGKSTRTHPLTVSKPKSLLKIANKTIIEHILSQLHGIVSEAVIVIGHEGKQISDYLGSTYGGIRLTFVQQKKQYGTGDALLAVEKIISGKFIVLMGDDLYNNEDIKKCVKHDYCILVKEVKDVSSFGDVMIKEGYLHDMVEKPEKSVPGHANTGFYVLDDKIFSVTKKLKKSSRGEYEITDAIKTFAKKEKVVVEEAGFWLPTTYPWSLLYANERLLDEISGDVYATVEKGVTIKGKVVVGRNTLLRAGTYIEGPVVIGEHCDIGPNCYIRPFTSIGNNCRVGNSVEVKNSIVMDNTQIGHLSYLGDSVIGENVNLAAGFIVANLRHDEKKIDSIVKGKLISSGRRKFGTVIADNVKTGIRTSIYPGRKIWPGKTTLPGEIVKKDVI
ncbi:glucose-1-phosphate thymidylyltransferase [Candidatus Woesearchaeota archaeon]|nr:glucose-1-phosphate thymidylyltransferase [Candidatus Woesearchaeota archaeon]|tara:strand:+ start:10269 stop:11453 length:1185 start_codon:yes stop_codon:yes gene_type:complete